MYIKKLILHKYNRLALTQIETLTYAPEEHIQIILGPNSSGKSSTLYEASPLPADLKKDYADDGYKRIFIEHLNKEYELSSGYYSKGKHSFICDNEELNQSGTKSIQLELVKHHFGLTPHIHDILIGNVTFSNMSLADRKKWLTTISHIDYSYAFSVYNKLKQRHRDLIGGIKITQSKLLQEDTLILSKESKDKLNKDIEILNTALEWFMSNRPVFKQNDTSYDIKNIINTIKNNLILINTTELNNQDINIDNRLEIIKTELYNHNKRISDISQRIDKIDETLKNTNITDKDMIIKLIEEYNTKIKYLIDLSTNKISDINNIKSIIDNFENTIPQLIDNIKILQEDHSYDYSKDQHDALLKEQEVSISNIDKLNRILTKINVTIEEQEKYKNDPKHICSKCGNECTHGYDQIAYDKLIKDRNNINIMLDKANTRKQEITNTLEQYDARNELFKNIRNLHHISRSQLHDIWQYLFYNIDITKDFCTILNRINEYKILLPELLNYITYDDELKKLQQQLKIIESVDKKEHELLTSERIQLEKEYKLIHDHILLLKNEEQKLNDYISNKNKLYDMYNALKKITKHYRNKYIQDINTLLYDSYTEVIKVLKYTIQDIDKQLRDSNLIEHNIKKTKDELINLQQREIVLGNMVKALSPTEGLIAKSINSFLNVFIDDINNVIKSVWSYELKLLPCDLSTGDDLDYYFPFSLNGQKPISDIKQASSGGKEIIDLAFKIIFIKYLKLIDYPLYLDEYAVKMDPVHRVNAYNVIGSVLAHNFSQVFIISHFESMYGSFKNSDISVFGSSTANIDPNLTFNKVMKMV